MHIVNIVNITEHLILPHSIISLTVPFITRNCVICLQTYKLESPVFSLLYLWHLVYCWMRNRCSLSISRANAWTDVCCLPLQTTTVLESSASASPLIWKAFVPSYYRTSSAFEHLQHFCISHICPFSCNMFQPGTFNGYLNFNQLKRRAVPMFPPQSSQSARHWPLGLYPGTLSWSHFTIQENAPWL